MELNVCISCSLEELPSQICLFKKMIEIVHLTSGSYNCRLLSYFPKWRSWKISRLAAVHTFMAVYKHSLAYFSCRHPCLLAILMWSSYGKIISHSGTINYGTCFRSDVTSARHWTGKTPADLMKKWLDTIQTAIAKHGMIW